VIDSPSAISARLRDFARFILSELPLSRFTKVRKIISGLPLNFGRLMPLIR